MGIFTSLNTIKRTVILFVFILSYPLHSITAQSFITTWNTVNPGSSNISSISIPTDGGAYNYDVDWDNDGVFDQFGIAAGITHDFGVPGIYTIRIQGDFPHIYFNNSGDNQKITEINQWGDIAWANMNNAFYGCSNLTSTAIDAPDLSNVSDMSGMFRASSITGDFSAWDVSTVTDLSFMFSFANQFNGDISGWNVSNVTNMRGLFWGASLYSQPLNDWDVSAATDMAFMFFFAEDFNQNLNTWNVSNVTNMISMFSFASIFNGDINTWDVGSVDDMSFMFSSAGAFDQDLGVWDISQVSDMSEMLSSTALSIENYDKTLIGWESQNVMQNVSFGANGLNYCEGASARSSLMAAATNNWNIVGDNKYCPYFITTWKTDFPGSSNATSITIPTAGGGYDYDVDWDNDGIFDEFGINGNITHDFGVAGIYTIQIKGDFPRIHFDNIDDKEKIITINQWGNIEWGSMAAAFYGCSNLNYAATDTPDLSNVTSMASMFQGATIFNGNISNWDVSNVTTMAFTFHSASIFNQDLNSWDVSIVEDMSRMFYFANAFNSDLNNWNVTNVTNMSRMFESAVVFNKSISTWNVSNVTDMSYMFRQADAFNQSISTWGVSNVTNMFNMFSSANAFDQDLGGWDISGVSNLENMLSNSGLSQGNYDNTLIGWASQNVLDNVDLGSNGLTYCAGETARSTLINTYNWNITGDTRSCYFTTTWNTTKPGDSPNDAITIPTQGVGYDYDVDWNNDGIFDQFGINGSVSHIFAAPGIYTINIKGDFPRIHFDFEGDKEKIINIDQWGDIEWSSMEEAFYGCINLNATATDVPNLSNVTTLSYMFSYAKKFNGDLSNWDVSGITSMLFMFGEASDFNSDISNWDVSNVENMSHTFAAAAAFNTDIGNWDVSSVTTMNRMFLYANAFNRDIGNWDVSNVTNMELMFYNAIHFNQNISNWDVSSVTTMNRMFYSAESFNRDIGNWDVSNVTNMESMFFNTSIFNQDLGDWDINSVTNMVKMLSGSGLSKENYDNTLIGWATQNVNPDINFGADGLLYCEGEAARDLLIDTHNWSINGDSKECPPPFITTWKTDNPGVSPDDAITIPTTGGGYNYDVDWNNDGVFDQLGINGSVSHIFPVPGTYTIRIRGDFPRIHFDNEGDKEKIINIDQWGDIEWSSMKNAFYGCSNLEITATDAPGLSNVTDCSYMFKGTNFVGENLSNWDVSNVNIMWAMFSGASVFNADLSNWDVSNVTSMILMFHKTTVFNAEISNWDVSNVNDMQHMFNDASSFNRDISNWDVSNVTNMLWMFNRAYEFNADISNWDVSNVTSMTTMFNDAYEFNADISNWDVSNVTSMSFMFNDASSFDRDLSNWDVSNVTSMFEMFDGASAFNQNLGGWNITSVTIMADMLSGSALSQENYDNTLIGWANQNVQSDVSLGAEGLTYCAGEAARGILINTHNWTITGDTKSCAFITTWKTDNPGVSPDDAITIPTTGGGYNYDVDWNNDGVYDQFGINGSVSHIFPVPGTYTIRIRGDFPRIYFNEEGDNFKITNIDQWGEIAWSSMHGAFRGCTNLNATATDAPDLSNVSDMSYMFHTATHFNGDVSNWNVSNVTNMDHLFSLALALDQSLNNWDVSNVNDMSGMFFGAWIFNGDVSSWDVSNVTEMDDMFSNAGIFNGNLSSWDVSNVTNMAKMFNQAGQFNQNLSSWNVSNVTAMQGMFAGARKFSSDIGNWDVSNVSDMSSMFSGAWIFNEDLGLWDVSAVTDMSFMFSSALVFNQDISVWNVSNVTDMRYMFSSTEAFNQDINIWDVENVTNMAFMFSNAQSFNQDIGDWNVFNVTKMTGMFKHADEFNQDIGDWNVFNVTVMASMFLAANSFNQSLGDWDITSVSNMEEMLDNSGLSLESYDQTLIGWASQIVQPFVSLGAQTLIYCEGEVARTLLIDAHNWVIDGDDLDCSVLPIELLYFNAEVNARNHVDLSWSTATEINNDFFTIERSKDGIQFEQIVDVSGAGNSFQTKTYISQDTRPYTGISYYRLKQTDFDGKLSYSDIKAVKIDIDHQYSIYPNPMKDVLHIIGDGNQNGKTVIEIYDALGNLKYSKHCEMNDNANSLDIYEVSAFIAGNYFLIIQDGLETQTFNLVKVRE